MDKKDWVVPLITGLIGVIAGLGGAMIAGHYQERVAYQQMQLELAKIGAMDIFNGVKELKSAAAQYLAEIDAFLSAVMLYPEKESMLIERLTKLQTAGAVLIILADVELAKYTNSVNANSASLLSGGSDLSINQKLESLAASRAEWMGQLRNSLDALRDQGEKGLILHSRS